MDESPILQSGSINMFPKQTHAPSERPLLITEKADPNHAQTESNRLPQIFTFIPYLIKAQRNHGIGSNSGYC